MSLPESELIPSPLKAQKFHKIVFSRYALTAVIPICPSLNTQFSDILWIRSLTVCISKRWTVWVDFFFVKHSTSSIFSVASPVDFMDSWPSSVSAASILPITSWSCRSFCSAFEECLEVVVGIWGVTFCNKSNNFQIRQSLSVGSSKASGIVLAEPVEPKLIFTSQTSQKLILCIHLFLLMFHFIAAKLLKPSAQLNS